MPPPGVYAFEEIDETLPLVPLAARRALDAAGKKLSLAGWLSLPVARRAVLVEAGRGERACRRGRRRWSRGRRPRPTR